MSAITAEQLGRWRAGDWRSFVETCCILRRPDGTIGPLLLSDRQAEWMDAVAARRHDGAPRYTTVGIVAPKRSGKTVVAAAAALYLTAIDEDRLSIFLGNSRESAESLSFDVVKEYLTRGPLGAWAGVQRGRIVFADLGSEMRAVPCSAKTVAGVTVTGALVSDELWQADDEEPWQLLSSQKSGGAIAVMVSQASGVQSAVHRLYETARDQAPEHLYFDYIEPDWIDEHTSPNPYIDEAYLAERRAELAIDAVFRHYFRNEWGGDAGEYLDAADLAAATRDDLHLPTTAAELEHLLREATGYGVADCMFTSGCDRAMPGSGAGDGSYLVTSARAPSDQVVVVQVADLGDGSKAAVVGAWSQIANMVGGWPRLLIEVYQSADLADDLGAETVTPSAPRQHEAFTALARLFAERRIAIPGDAEVLSAQLGRFGIDTGRHPPAYGKRVNRRADDAVYALVWSVYDQSRPAEPVDAEIVIAQMASDWRAYLLDTGVGAANLP